MCVCILSFLLEMRWRTCHAICMGWFEWDDSQVCMGWDNGLDNGSVKFVGRLMTFVGRLMVIVEKGKE